VIALGANAAALRGGTTCGQAVFWEAFGNEVALIEKRTIR
jgi:hypothetical protein